MTTMAESGRPGRRILLASLGLAPQTLTETVWALARQEPAFVPDEVHVVTTAEGARRAELSLLHPIDGRWGQLAKALGHERLGSILTPAGIHVIEDARARPLDDIVDVAQNTAAADQITRLVARLTTDSDATLHVSIAGGRKTMGYFLGYALSLFGRPQDRLSHVLVGDPFQQHPDFFFPPDAPRLLHDRQGRPWSTADAVIHLAEIPFVRLRQGLPEAMLAGHGQLFGRPSPELDRKHRPAAPEHRFAGSPKASVFATTNRSSLSDVSLAWLALFAAEEARNRQPGATARPGPAPPSPATAFLDHYARRVGPASGAFEKTAEALDRPDRTRPMSTNAARASMPSSKRPWAAPSPRTTASPPRAAARPAARP